MKSKSHIEHDWNQKQQINKYRIMIYVYIFLVLFGTQLFCEELHHSVGTSKFSPILFETNLIQYYSNPLPGNSFCLFNSQQNE